MFELTESEKKKIKKKSLIDAIITLAIFMLCIILMVMFAREDNLIFFEITLFIGLVIFFIAMLPKKITIKYDK